jgi:hypothetical protein
MDMQTDQEQIVRKYIDAYNRFDIDAMLALMSEDVRFSNIAGGKINGETAGKRELEQLARQSAELFRTRTQWLKSINVTGEKVITEIDFSAVLAKDMPNGLKTGDAISMQGKSEFVLKGGLIASIVDES